MSISSSQPSTTIRVTLNPIAGYCIKSNALSQATCQLTPDPTATTAPAANQLQVIPGALTIPRGIKIFVNVAWDSNVPPPPPADEAVIKRAMQGEEESWFVPVVVSEPREVTDKAGKPSVVFDCVYNSSLKSRALKDLEFRAFLYELSLQRVEAQHVIVLARPISTPNIASKGKLSPRNALIPIRLFPKDHPLAVTEGAKKLIEEVNPSEPKQTPTSKPKSILKNSSPKPSHTPSVGAVPSLSWSKDSDRIRITVKLPKLTRSDIPKTTLDLEPRRIILSASTLYNLDLNLDLPDAQLPDVFKGDSDSAQSSLRLKRERDLDVDGARAEWRTDEGVLIILA